MADVVGAFIWREERERRREEGAHLVEGARPHRAEKRFELREGEFDRIEVRTVRREKPDVGADLFDGGVHLGLLVDREIVEDDDIARPQRGHEDLLDIGQERRVVDRAVEDGRRVEAIEP